VARCVKTPRRAADFWAVARPAPRRRRLKRRARPVLLRFASPTARGKGHVRNLRRNGLFVATRLLPKPLEQVRIAIRTGHHAKIEVRGVVRWTSAERPKAASDSGFGVQIDPSPEYLAFFESLLVG
jgi:hypothetical protein